MMYESKKISEGCLEKKRGIVHAAVNFAIVSFNNTILYHQIFNKFCEGG